MSKLTTVNISLFLTGNIFIYFPFAAITRRVTVLYNYLPVNIIFILMVFRRQFTDQLSFEQALAVEYEKRTARGYGQVILANLISFFFYQLLIQLLR